MKIATERVEYREVEALRELYRHEARCQIVHDSRIRRGHADPYLVFADGRLAGYGGVLNRFDPGCVMEFWVMPSLGSYALPLFQEFLAASQATHIIAQTNMPLMLTLLYDCATDIKEEAILFHTVATTNLPPPKGVFRKSFPEEQDAIFEHHHEPVGDWVIELEGAVVATGGFLTHYNPPYGDVYMEVTESARQQGIGSYLVQELKRACYEAGRLPSARCNPTNIASRKTLQKAGFAPCGRLLMGRVRDGDLSSAS